MKKLCPLIIVNTKRYGLKRFEIWNLDYFQIFVITISLERLDLNTISFVGYFYSELDKKYFLRCRKS